MLVVDGIIGKKTIAAFYDQITNTKALAITAEEIAMVAIGLDVSAKQIRAVASVESNGGGYTKEGRPKILFERHKFWALTGGKHPISAFNNPKYGDYSISSWAKLEAALTVDPIAALQACSWGKFQIMGYHAAGSNTAGSLDLGYAHVFHMITRMVRSEYEHYVALSRFINKSGLAPAMRRISTDPNDNRAFVRGYNGVAGIERNNYHVKLAEAMR